MNARFADVKWRVMPVLATLAQLPRWITIDTASLDVLIGDFPMIVYSASSGILRMIPAPLEMACGGRTKCMRRPTCTTRN
jgi:hypothetical protein